MSSRFFAQMAYLIWLAYGVMVMFTSAMLGERRLQRRLRWCDKLSLNGNAYWDYVEMNMFGLSYTMTTRITHSKWYKKHPRIGKWITLVEDFVMRIVDLTLWPLGVYHITQLKDYLDARITQLVCKYE